MAKLFRIYREDVESQYLAHGWKVVQFPDPDNFDDDKYVKYFSKEESVIRDTMHNNLVPYLIQRACIRTSVPYQSISEIQKLSINDVCDWDYMGSSEFEWGALHCGVRNMCHDLFAYKVTLSERFVWYRPSKKYKNGYRTRMHIFHNFSEERLSEYMQYFMRYCDMSGTNNHYRFKEFISLPKYLKSVEEQKNEKFDFDRITTSTDNFWFDIENGVMMSFRGDVILAMRDILKNSMAEFKTPIN